MATDMSADLPDYGNRADNAYESDIDGHVRHGNIGMITIIITTIIISFSRS